MKKTTAKTGTVLTHYEAGELREIAEALLALARRCDDNNLFMRTKTRLGVDPTARLDWSALVGELQATANAVTKRIEDAAAVEPAQDD